MTAREVALGVVRDVFPPPGTPVPERGAQESLDYRSRKATLSARDRAFATELAYGSIKMRRTLDWYLQPFVGERAATLPPAVHEILRLAIYELTFTNADVHATVFEFVNLAKRYGHRGLANLVNAVLRSFLRDKPAAPARESFETDADYLGTAYSLPTWLVRQWMELFGDRVAEICAAVNDPATPAIVVNSNKAPRDAIAETLREEGIQTKPSAFADDCLLVETGGGVHEAERRAHGLWWTQSESAAMPVAVLNPQPAERVLDVCSGRGNKALQIAARLEGDGTLVCLERDTRKAGVLEKRIAEAGLAAGMAIGDATQAVLDGDARFDRVLVDAPCSGVGVVGRHPEARWKKQGTDGERLAITQRAILEESARHVESGGALVYCVCSTDPRETIEVADWFLARSNFERGLIPAAYEPFLTAHGDILVPPGIAGRDGFFIARFERR